LCEGKLTGAWSKGKNNRYAYYFCQTKGCPLKHLSIRKKDLEEGLDNILLEMTTADNVIELAKAIFIEAKEKDEKNVLAESEIKKGRKSECEREIERYAELASKASADSVVAQYEKKIEKLIDELKDIETDLAIEFDYAIPYRTALDKILGILKNPYQIWSGMNVFEKHKFFSFLFETNLEYERNIGYRTPKYSVLKRVCEQIEVSDSLVVEMARVERACSQGRT